MQTQEKFSHRFRRGAQEGCNTFLNMDLHYKRNHGMTRPQVISLCSSRKYAYSPHGRFFVSHASPLRKFQLSFMLWVLRPPPPPGISDDLPWGGYGFFLELHIVDTEHELPISLTLSMQQDRMEWSMPEGYSFYSETFFMQPPIHIFATPPSLESVDLVLVYYTRLRCLIALPFSRDSH